MVNIDKGMRKPFILKHNSLLLGLLNLHFVIYEHFIIYFKI